MNPDLITIMRAGLNEPVGRELIQALNDELSAAYPEPGATHFSLSPEEVTGSRGVFLIIHQGGVPVGCGAVRRVDQVTGELKRMYVAPAARGKGLGRRLIEALEAEARSLGMRRLILETGIRQAAAQALYRSRGFETIPHYGEYCLSAKTSICLGKNLIQHVPGGSNDKIQLHRNCCVL
jgi:GNAT superfamily N-acetyltransferase